MDSYITLIFPHPEKRLPVAFVAVRRNTLLGYFGIPPYAIMVSSKQSNNATANGGVPLRRG